MAERMVEVISAVIREKPRPKYGPRVRVGQRQRGPSSTPSDEEGFTYGVYGRPKGAVRPDLSKSKNVCEQLEPVYGS